MKKKSAIAFSLAALAVLALAGCTGGSGSASSASKVITIALASPPVSLDPSKAANGFYSNYVDPTYASLIDEDSSGKPVPGLAASWKYVGDGNTEFEMTLRDGLKWADGTPLTAADAVASIEYIANGSGPTGPLLKPLKVTAPDAKTIHVSSPTPNPVLPSLFTPSSLGGALISPAGLAAPDALANNTFEAGEYVLDAADTVTGDHYVYTPNANYYDQSAISWQKITIKVIPNMTSAVQALTTGQVDYVVGDPESAAAFKQTDQYAMVHTPAIWNGLFLLDRDGTVVPALKDIRVRQALNYAIDRQSIAKAVYGDFGTATTQTQVPGSFGYSDSANSVYSYDPAKAKRLLADAGYANGITIPVNYGSFDAFGTKLIQAVQDQLSAVGVTLQLQGDANFGAWVNSLVSKQYAATMLPGGQGNGPYFTISSNFMPGGIMNVFGAEDPSLTTTFNAYLAAPDDQSSQAAINAVDVTVNDALALPVVASDSIAFYNTRLSGVGFQAANAAPTLVTSWTTK